MPKVDQSLNVNSDAGGVGKRVFRWWDVVPIEYIADAKNKAKLASIDSLPMASGVYLVLHKPTDKIYVGRSICMAKRIKIHLSQLRHKKSLSNDWIEDFHNHGEKAFGSAVIIYADLNESKIAESQVLSLLKSNECYNIQCVDFYGKATLGAEYVARLTDKTFESYRKHVLR